MTRLFYHLLKALCGIGFLVSLDQFTKYGIQQLLTPSSFMPVTSFFNLVYVKNKGVSFGLFQAGSSLGIFFLIFLAAVILICLSVWYFKTANTPLTAFGLILIMAGAIGNLIDRIRFGSVVDFLDFHLHTWHFPAFNIADSVITLGALVMFFTPWLESPHLSFLKKSKK